MSDKEGVVVVPVYVGLNRPAMAFGIPLKAFILECVFFFDLFILTKSFLVALGFVISHAILFAITSVDIGIFEDIGMALRTSFRKPSMIKYWGSRSLAPVRKEYGRSA